MALFTKGVEDQHVEPLEQLLARLRHRIDVGAVGDVADAEAQCAEVRPVVLPDGGEREPEFPAGIGRLWEKPDGLPAAVADYLALVRRFNERNGVVGDELKFYPGSPWVAKLLLRAQDRMAL